MTEADFLIQSLPASFYRYNFQNLTSVILMPCNFFQKRSFRIPLLSWHTTVFLVNLAAVPAHGLLSSISALNSWTQNCRNVANFELSEFQHQKRKMS